MNVNGKLEISQELCPEWEVYNDIKPNFIYFLCNRRLNIQSKYYKLFSFTVTFTLLINHLKVIQNFIFKIHYQTSQNCRNNLKADYKRLHIHYFK